MVATVLNNNIDAEGDFFSNGKYFLIAFTAPITFISKSFLKSSRVKVEMGFKLILPGQYIRQSRLSISGYSSERASNSSCTKF